ncbi:TRAP transporter large permease [Paenibacillus sp.]|uniref:TRAP transporter large permease n=1 Tax=Paenibacillus sp. TaxID=58172 RepID=UPI002D609064|nr:TRAP transporter large permease [Paenibacillus sp.]HZG87474.1 TRAP transporter large permease [Paenibacillus sp.]
MEVLIPVILIFVLILLKVPVSFSLIAGTLTYFLLSDSQISSIFMVQRMVAGVESIPLMAILFFVAVGVLMNYSGISKRLINFSEVVTGRLPGGLAQVNVLLSTLMGGLSGSGLADAAMQSKILVPEMEKKGYDRAFSTAVTAASSIITPIIPPGIALILYGYIANVSIGKLFVAGIVPGIMLCIILMVTVHIISKKRGYQPIRETWATPVEIIKESRHALVAFILPVLIIGGIRIGAFTPTEAGAMAVVFTLLLGLVIYREMKLEHLKIAIVESVSTTASILLLIASSSAFAWVLTMERIPHKATDFVLGFVDNPLLFLVIVNIFLLFIGLFIEGNVAMIILVPLLMPMVGAYGIDPVHFGIMLIMNLSIGTLTPPMGTVMLTTCSITKTRIEDFIRAVLPFWLALLVALLLITFVPQISLLLVDLLY